MIFFDKNLKSLRKSTGLTQSQLAEKLSINRATLASYEEGRAEPKFGNLLKMSSFFKVSLDDLLQKDLVEEGNEEGWKQNNLQILPIVVDKEDNERISLVSHKATAGYLEGYSDPEYIEELPSFSLPFDQMSQGTYRAFQIDGESMLPIPSGSYILSRFEDDWRAIRDDSPYIVVSQNDGLTYKRISIDARTELLHLKADNIGYEPYSVALHAVKELWKAVGYISFDLDQQLNSSSNDIEQMKKMLFSLKDEMTQLKKNE